MNTDLIEQYSMESVDVEALRERLVYIPDQKESVTMQTAYSRNHGGEMERDLAVEAEIEAKQQRLVEDYERAVGQTPSDDVVEALKVTAYGSWMREQEREEAVEEAVVA